MSEAPNRFYAIKNRHGDYVALLRTREEAETFEGGLWDGDTIEELVHSTALLADRKETIERCAKVAEAAGDTWSNSRDVSTCIQEAAIDVKCEQIAAAIRSLGRE